MTIYLTRSSKMNPPAHKYNPQLHQSFTQHLIPSSHPPYPHHTVQTPSDTRLRNNSPRSRSIHTSCNNRHAGSQNTYISPPHRIRRSAAVRLSCRLAWCPQGREFGVDCLSPLVRRPLYPATGLPRPVGLDWPIPVRSVWNVAGGSQPSRRTSYWRGVESCWAKDRGASVCG